jgi:hypothetical protein
MNLIIIISTPLIISGLVLLILFQSDFLSKEILFNTEVSLFSIITSLLNLVGIVLYAKSVINIKDITEPPSKSEQMILFISYMFLFYITFLLIVGYLIVSNTIGDRKLYVLFNSIFLVSIVPFIIYKEDIWFYDKNITDIDEDDFIDTTIEKGGGLDLVEYDSDGKRELITERKVDTDEQKKKMEEDIEIRRDAARSEYNERSDIESGAYY